MHDKMRAPPFSPLPQFSRNQMAKNNSKMRKDLRKRLLRRLLKIQPHFLTRATFIVF